jgi:hypothetical protein
MSAIAGPAAPEKQVEFIMRMTRSILCRLLQGMAVLALLSRAAAAQLPLNMPLQHDKAPMSQEEMEKQKALDDAYKSATNKIPDKKVDDPWATVRPSAGTPATTKKKQPQ